MPHSPSTGGAVLSTVTVCVSDALFPAASYASAVTVWLPSL
ncbi:MAG: hypothetical protein ACFFC7_08725 [Candidatus Hermodarchaeota archaeon]